MPPGCGGEHREKWFLYLLRSPRKKSRKTQQSNESSGSEGLAESDPFKKVPHELPLVPTSSSASVLCGERPEKSPLLPS